MSYKKISLESRNESFAGIMSNGKSYSVPRFQRDYSWQADQWDELWQDIAKMRERRQQHFMGYLVLQSRDGKHHRIIDGQQRITTITMLIVAALSRLGKLIEESNDAENNSQRLASYKSTYLGVFDEVTLRTRPKLVLNRHNKSHFEQIINNYSVPRVRGITATNRHLNKALEFFQKKFADFDGERLAELINSVADNLVFSSITTMDDINAYVVFETLNARGVHLSAPDLLKNYLLSVMDNDSAFGEGHFEDFESQWGGIIEQLGETNFTSFLRTYHGMRGRLHQKRDMYRIIKEQITGAQASSVMPYMDDIGRYAPLYAALQKPDDSFWREYEDGQYGGCQTHLQVLSTFSIRTPMALLMAAYFKFSAQDFIRLVRWIAAVSVRYNVVCGKMSYEQEAVYNRLANRVMSGDIDGIQDLADGLRPVYPGDEEFANAFAGKSLPSRRSPKKILHLLKSIEKHVSRGDEPPANITLEHVLPYNPDDQWQESFGRDYYSDAIDRLGNMAMQPDASNMEQEPFAEKRAALAASPYAINRKIAEYPEWNMENLNAHQQWLARQAIATWQISNLR